MSWVLPSPSCSTNAKRNRILIVMTLEPHWQHYFATSTNNKWSAHSLGFLGVKYQVFLGKRGYGMENQHFPTKNMVLDQKTNMFWETIWPDARKKLVFFSQGKVGFGVKNQLFPRETQKNHLFGVWPHSFPKDVVFVCWFSSVQNHLFHKKKLLLLVTTPSFC